MRFIIVIGTPWKSGGNSVLYHLNNSLTKLGYESCLTMIDQPAYDFWSAEYPDTNIINDRDIQKNDVLIVPEEFVFMIAFLANRTTNYVIINQGFSATFNSDFGKKNNYHSNVQVYNNALAVLCNSKHTALSIENWLHVPKENIVPFRVHVSDIFVPGVKKNKITFMSKKNFHFCRFVINYLEGKYQEWEFEDIKGATKEEVAGAMATSKIFLSFGGPEGFGLPPVEAALCGNKVIGFDGYGGEEYFMEPVFTDVPFGNHYAYLLKTTEQLPIWLNESILDDYEAVKQINELREYYSETSTMNSIKDFIRRIDGKVRKY